MPGPVLGATVDIIQKKDFCCQRSCRNAGENKISAFDILVSIWGSLTGHSVPNCLNLSDQRLLSLILSCSKLSVPLQICDLQNFVQNTYLKNLAENMVGLLKIE